ncbi:MAG TPA: hypothetical protein VJ861_07115, partial [Treponemataceae bacterium]|nr:hypothetical protein [Treponemataceae bacterium]
MSLSDDIWNSIDHNNPEKLDEGYAFKKEFNRLLDIFNANSSEISALVSQFTGIKTESIPEEIKKENDENQRRVKELNKKTPHHISEDFTYKRPYAFIFDDCAYTQILTWNDIYIQFVSCLARKDSEKLKEL